MSSGFQHCPACDEEYVAGIAACVECGGALQPGPLPRLERGERRAAAAVAPVEAATGAAAGAPDTLLTELRGREAHEAAVALLQEGIVCAVECDGASKVYLPHQSPREPFAVTRQVSLFVAADQVERAGEILASLQSEDLIGEQWADVPPPEAGLADEVDPPPADSEPPSDAAPLAPSRSTMNVVWVVLLGLALLVFMLAGR